MATVNQLYKAAGIATLDDATKCRFSDDLSRGIKRYTKAGATRVSFIELPTAMTRADALSYMLSHDDFQNADDQGTVTAAMTSKSAHVVKAGNRDKPGKEAKKPKKEKPAPTKKNNITLASIKIRAKNNVSLESVMGAWSETSLNGQENASDTV